MSRTARTGDLMWLRLFRRFEAQADTLQGQLRDMLVHAVMEGFLAPGAALPASRVLAQTLSLSRTTVILALQALADRGLLVSRPRSGYFVADAFQAMVSGAGQAAGQEAPAGGANWRERLVLQPSAQRNIVKPSDWQQQPYPFIYGQFDASLFPFRDWRACALESLQAEADYYGQLTQWVETNVQEVGRGRGGREGLGAVVDSGERCTEPERGAWHRGR